MLINLDFKCFVCIFALGFKISIMTKRKIAVKSVRSINMANLCYMRLHRRMYVVSGSHECPSPTIHLVLQDPETDVFVPITDSAYQEYLDYEMSFDSMLNLFSSLCFKYSFCSLSF